MHRCPFMARHSLTGFTITHPSQLSHAQMSIHGQTLTDWIRHHTSKSAQSCTDVHSWPDTHLLDSPSHIQVSSVMHRCPFMARHSPSGFTITHPSQLSHAQLSIHGQTLTHWIHHHIQVSSVMHSCPFMARHSRPGFTITHPSQLSHAQLSIHGQTLTHWIHHHIQVSSVMHSCPFMARHSRPGFTITHPSQLS